MADAINRFVTNPYGSKLPYGASIGGTALGLGGEEYISTIHPKYYNYTKAGIVFNANTLTAGTIIPVMATNLVSTFTIWNPMTSPNDVVLLDYQLAMVALTTVVGDVSLYFQTGVGSFNTAPGTLTSLTAKNMLLGGGATPQATVYSAATLVGALSQGGVGVQKGPTLFAFGSTGVTGVESSGTMCPRVEFDGRIILPPGTLATIAGGAAQTGAAIQHFTWAELPH